VDLLRRLVAKYAANDPDVTDPKEMPTTGTTLMSAIFQEYDLRFIELAAAFDGQVPSTITIGQALLIKYKELYRPLHIVPDVPTWTDDYSDVLRVMMIPEIQKLRGWFGLPNKLE
jgi:hypothetical protein